MSFKALQTIHKLHKKRVSLLHRTATTPYRCFDQDLTEFGGSWSCRTYPLQSYNFFFFWQRNSLFLSNSCIDSVVNIAKQV